MDVYKSWSFSRLTIGVLTNQNIRKDIHNQNNREKRTKVVERVLRRRVGILEMTIIKSTKGYVLQPFEKNIK